MGKRAEHNPPRNGLHPGNVLEDVRKKASFLMGASKVASRRRWYLDWALKSK